MMKSGRISLGGLVFRLIFLTVIICTVISASLMFKTSVSTSSDNMTSQNPLTKSETKTAPEAPTSNAEKISSNSPVPYTLKITRADLPIFDSHSYDSSYVGAVGAAGTYTIVEEAEDTDGSLWGRMKSGIGWINLQEANITSEAPIAAMPADERLLNDLQYHEYIRDRSEHTVKLLFLPSETLKDVCFTSLQYENGAMAVAEELYSLPELSPDMPLVAGVVFYGDLTTYGISFTDSNGVQRYFSVYISGRNGALEMTEYTP